MSAKPKLMVDAEAIRKVRDLIARYPVESAWMADWRLEQEQLLLALTPQLEKGEAIEMHLGLSEPLTEALKALVLAGAEKEELVATLEARAHEVKNTTGLDKIIEKMAFNQYPLMPDDSLGQDAAFIALQIDDMRREIWDLREAEQKRERERQEWHAEWERDVAEINAMSDEEILHQLDRAGVSREDSEREARQFGRLAHALAKEGETIRQLREEIASLQHEDARYLETIWSKQQEKELVRLRDALNGKYEILLQSVADRVFGHDQDQADHVCHPHALRFDPPEAVARILLVVAKALGVDQTVVMDDQAKQAELDEKGYVTATPTAHDLWPRKCPTCDSHSPHLHPAMQHEGEVELCKDPWHRGEPR